VHKFTKLPLKLQGVGRPAVIYRTVQVLDTATKNIILKIF